MMLTHAPDEATSGVGRVSGRQAADVFVSTPDLRPSIRGIVNTLDVAGRLAGLATTLALYPGGRLVSIARALGGSRVERRLSNRFVDRSLLRKTTSFWTRELLRLGTQQLAGPTAAHHVWRWSELSFDRAVARRFSGRFPCLYGMEHSSLVTFRKQKAAGGLCLLRQVTAHPAAIRRALSQAAEKHPGFVDGYYASLLQEMDQTIARKSEEYQLADLIVGNSAFVQDSFIAEGFAPERVTFVPTGCPPLPSRAARSGRTTERLRFLFVGTLSLRKGIIELLEAWALSGAEAHADLWIAGPAELPADRLLKDVAGVRYWGQVDRSRLAELLHDADVFVLPTRAEGLSHALLEALSAGLPIVTTSASGCGSFVEDGRNGLILRDESPASVASALVWCLDHRSALPDMGRLSREQAAAWTVGDSNRAHFEIVTGALGAGLKNRPLHSEAGRARGIW